MDSIVELGEGVRGELRVVSVCVRFRENNVLILLIAFAHLLMKE